MAWMSPRPFLLATCLLTGAIVRTAPVDAADPALPPGLVVMGDAERAFLESSPTMRSE
jgi:hypothetical protein